MSVKEIAELLVKQGHKVNVRKRSDGGYIITSIDGMKYVGATGNIEARRIVGATLSHARAYQLKRIKPPKRVAPAKRKKAPIPEDLKRDLTRVQREWRKKHEDVGGAVSTRGLRYILETYGYDVAKASLDKSLRYAQGYAYIENVQWLIERLRQAMNKAEDNEVSMIQSIIDYISDHILTFKEEWINACYQAIYEFEKQSISASELAQRLQQIIK